jgi:hypothetical protein
VDEAGFTRVDESIGSGVDAILAAAREAAAGIVADAERSAEDTRLAVEAYAERVRREAEDEARQVRAELQAERERLVEDAREAARAEAEQLAESNAGLRSEAHVLASRRDRILRELESIAHDVDDAVAELAPEDSRSLGEALDVRRRS